MKRILITILVLTSFMSFAQEEQPMDSIAASEEKKSTLTKIKDNLTGSFESNIQWYNDTPDQKFTEAGKDNTGEEHLRANSYLRLDYNAAKNLTLGIQAESYAPMSLLNYSPRYDSSKSSLYTNLAQYYANFNNGKIDVTAGYFYEQYGSGLLLRSWEDRPLGINNSIRGLRFQWTPSNSFNMSAFWGQQRVGFEVGDSDLFGANMELDLANMFKAEKLSGFTFGLSYLGKLEDYVGIIRDNKVADIQNSVSGRFDVDFGKVYTSFEYVAKGEDVRLDNSGEIVEGEAFDGSAILWTLGYSQKGFGISSTFRRMENMRFYAERTAAGVSNTYNEQIVNYLPGLTKQHDYTLTNTYVYQSQPGLIVSLDNINAGEIGSQFDLYYKIKKGTALGGKYGTKISANISYWASLATKANDPDYDPTATIPAYSDKLTYESEFLNFKKKLFKDVNFEIRKKWSKRFSSIFTYVNIEIDKNLQEGIDIGNATYDGKYVKSHTAVVESTLKFSKGRSARLELQHLWAKNDMMNNWAGGTAELNLSSKFGLYVNDSWNYGHDEVEEQKHYYNVGCSYTKGATRIAFNYGKQRGGLLCVGGVCRVVSENTGLTVNIATSF